MDINGDSCRESSDAKASERCDHCKQDEVRHRDPAGLGEVSLGLWPCVGQPPGNMGVPSRALALALSSVTAPLVMSSGGGGAAVPKKLSSSGTSSPAGQVPSRTQPA